MTGLDHGKLASAGPYGGVTKHRHPRDVWRNLLEQLQPFPAEVKFGHNEACNIAAGSRQAVHDAKADRIVHDRKHDRYSAGRSP